jgi:[CysO sulfur-carrier protein]-thiocarboxylate-dependent cysteine synthase
MPELTAHARKRDVLSLIGNTPLIELTKLSPRPGIRLFAKLEYMNPTGSVKDRIVYHMLVHAEDDGLIEPGDTIIEASTGNTGISLAMIGGMLGYSVQIVMPENVYPLIPEMLEAHGATVHRVTAQEGVKGAVETARRFARERGWYMLDQFANQHNTRAHYETTGPEILRDLPTVDAFVAGLGTGGTLTGVGRRLKEANPATKVIAIEPHPGSHVQGLKSLSDGYLPPIFDLGVLDGKILVRSSAAFRGAAELMQQESMFVGISAGAVLHAGFRLAERIEKGNIVLLFADAGWKYLGTRLWTEPPSPDEESLDDVLWW